MPTGSARGGLVRGAPARRPARRPGEGDESEGRPYRGSLYACKRAGPHPHWRLVLPTTRASCSPQREPLRRAPSRGAPCRARRSRLPRGRPRRRLHAPWRRLHAPGACAAAGAAACVAPWREAAAACAAASRAQRPAHPWRRSGGAPRRSSALRSRRVRQSSQFRPSSLRVRQWARPPPRPHRDRSPRRARPVPPAPHASPARGFGTPQARASRSSGAARLALCSKASPLRTTVPVRHASHPWTTRSRRRSAEGLGGLRMQRSRRRHRSPPRSCDSSDSSGSSRP